ncbi:YisL family protein [Salipaludibacillus sp. CF4.18]|uniref:YisL family protein n=1 Tax=Salipaludibacillus sp. CF4.18 TaxID=3373081 RepID=UPI003EE622F2
MFYTTHTHIFTWVVALILFLVAVYLFKAGNAKASKIVHMSLRLFYVLIIITGVILFIEFSANNAALYGVKFLVGLLVIGFSEMVLVRMKKSKGITGVVIGLIVSLLITLYLGLRLPIGFNFFG